MAQFTYTVTTEEAGLELKRIVKTHFSFSSRLMTKLKHNELIFLNGESAPGWVQVAAGDIVEIKLPEDEASQFPPEDIPLDVVYEDSDILVINKQPGIVVHPTKGKPFHTIANALTWKMREDDEFYKIRFVNRLDMNTSGLLIIAKNSHSQDNLVKQMKRDHIQKKYLALVDGIPEPASGTIDKPIGRPDEDEVERWLLPVGDGGFESVTHYRVLESYRRPEDLKHDESEFEGLSAFERINYPETYSLVELRLETGRTHQIRIHLASIGHPVTGDHLYFRGDPFEFRRINGDPRPPKDGTPGPRMEPTPELVSDLIDRQALHAYSLTFIHPMTGEEMHLEAPLPDDIKAAIAKLEKI